MAVRSSCGLHPTLSLKSQLAERSQMLEAILTCEPHQIEDRIREYCRVKRTELVDETFVINFVRPPTFKDFLYSPLCL